MREISAILALFALLAAPHAQQAPRTPSAPPGQDRHEGLTVSAVPCVDADKAEEIFGKQNPYKVGILALDVTFRNETPQPMRLTTSTIRLEVGPEGGTRDRLETLSPRQVARLIIYPAGSPDVTTKKRLPVGVTPSKDKKADKLTEALRPFALDADVIPPMATIHGYLFFDMDHDFKLVADSMLYVPDVKIIPGNKPLMFFEVPLGVTAQP